MDIERYQPLWYEKAVLHQSDVYIVRNMAAAFAERLDFASHRVSDIRLCTTELAQNHIDHKTTRGCMRIFGQMLTDKEALIHIASLDKGPGFGAKLGLGARDRLGSGLGVGLGTVRRLADDFGICSGKVGGIPCPDLLSGKREVETLVGASFLRDEGSFAQLPVEFSFLTRPSEGETFCGDGVCVLFEYPYLQIVVMDALGKGREAAEVVALARKFLSLVPAGIDPVDLMLSLGSRILGSRGLMAQAIRLHLEKAELKVVTAGDIGHFLFLDGKERFLSGHSGLVGQINSRSALVETSFSGFNQIMGIAFTDGLGAIPKIRFNQVLMDIPALVWANYLFPISGEGEKAHDDATVVVWKWEN